MRKERAKPPKETLIKQGFVIPAQVVSPSPHAGEGRMGVLGPRLREDDFIRGSLRQKVRLEP